MNKIKSAWESDLQIILSKDIWTKCLKLVHSSSICARHSLIQFKIVHRAHLSKDKLAKIFPTINPLCDRCRNGVASLFHMFWSCSALDHYWKEIFNAFSRIFSVTIQPHPITALFGVVIENSRLSVSDCHVIAFATLMARRSILLRWKDSIPPSYAQWMTQTLSCLNLEKIRCNVLKTEVKFDKMWHTFMEYFNV